MANKKAISDKNNYKKTNDSLAVNYDSQRPVWRFDKLDRDGMFAFNLDEVNHRLVLEKLIEYGNLTWGEIKRQTHDKKDKSKHHYLSIEKLSKEAVARIKVKHFEDYSDIIFSMALTNTVRLIGIKEKAEFFIVWYDKNHLFCPSSK